MISGIPDSVQDPHLESTVTSILMDILLMLNQEKWRTAKELVNLRMALKRLYQ